MNNGTRPFPNSPHSAKKRQEHDEVLKKRASVLKGVAMRQQLRKAGLEKGKQAGSAENATSRTAHLPKPHLSE